MENNLRRICLFAALLWTCFAAPAFADANTETDVGALAALLAGTHVGSDNPVPVSGIVPGALLEVTQHVDRFRLHLEGLPTIGAAGTNSGAFGHSSATLSLLNSTVLIDVDPLRRFRVGAGFQLVTLSSKNGSNGDVDDVRITSPIYTAGATLPAGKDRFVEANIMVDPNLKGNLLVFDYLGNAHANKPEAGAEVDYSAAYGWHHRAVDYLLGFRGLSYHTRNTILGELVDRNVGAGLTFEARFLLGR